MLDCGRLNLGSLKDKMPFHWKKEMKAKFSVDGVQEKNLMYQHMD